MERQLATYGVVAGVLLLVIVVAAAIAFAVQAESHIVKFREENHTNFSSGEPK